MLSRLFLQESLSKIRAQLIPRSLYLIKLLFPFPFSGEAITIAGFLNTVLPKINASSLPQVQATAPQIYCQGIKIPLETNLFEAWEVLSHADMFLYLCVISESVNEDC